MVYFCCVNGCKTEWYPRFGVSFHRWHVRTRENIARVRRDEAEAAEKERLEKERIENADREARLNILKLKSKQKLKESGIVDKTVETPEVLEHVNLFANIDHAVKTTNKEHDNEAKEKTEEYEKKIGYLTYLGQDTNEALKKKNWYEVLPESSRFTRSSDIKDTYDKLVLKDADGKPKAQETEDLNGEVSWKSKQRQDPVNAFKEYCHKNKAKMVKQSSNKIDKIKIKHKSKKKEHKKDKDDKELKKQKLLKLREARLKREQQEKQKTKMFLTGLNKPAEKVEPEVSKVKPKYNSQFNPELARQNYR